MSLELYEERILTNTNGNRDRYHRFIVGIVGILSIFLSIHKHVRHFREIKT